MVLAPVRTSFLPAEAEGRQPPVVASVSTSAGNIQDQRMSILRIVKIR